MHDAHPTVDEAVSALCERQSNAYATSRSGSRLSLSWNPTGRYNWTQLLGRIQPAAMHPALMHPAAVRVRVVKRFRDYLARMSITHALHPLSVKDYVVRLRGLL